MNNELKNIAGVYMFINKINGKKYIGISSNLDKRYKEHKNAANRPGEKSLLYRSMKKYGFENFEFKVLKTFAKNFEYYEKMKEEEVRYIKKFNTLKPNGLNMTEGGNHNPSLYPDIVEKRTKRLLEDPIVNQKLAHKGEKNPNAKLKLDHIVDIRRRYGQWEDWEDVYKDYSHLISKYGFKAVWWNTSWKEIEQHVYEKRPLRNTGGSKSSNIELVRQIRDFKLNGYPKGFVRKHYYQDFGSAGFNKVWWHLTWKDILPEAKNAKEKYQNPKADKDHVKEIRRRQAEGETLEDVYFDFADFFEMVSFKRVWNKETYKGVS